MAADATRELLILGILRRAPMSAYHVDRAVHGHSPLYRPLKSGNVYYALDRLALEGLVVERKAKAARGPSRTKSVYRLSAAGERRFRSLLRETLLDVQAGDAALQVAYVLLGQLARRVAAELLAERHARFVEHERRLGRLLGDIESRGGSAFIAHSHSFNRARAEQRFLREALARLDDVKWSPSWELDDGPIVDEKRRL